MGKMPPFSVQQLCTPLRDQETDVSTRRLQVAEADQQFNNLATAQNSLLTILFVWFLKKDTFLGSLVSRVPPATITVRRTDQFLT